MGSFLADFMEPIISSIQDVLDPIQPVIDVLTKPLPVLSDVGPLRDLLDENGDGAVTLIEMAALLSDDIGKVATFIEAVDEISDIAELLGNFSTIGSTVLYNLGAFYLGAVDVRKVTNLSSAVPNVTAGPGSLPGSNTQEGQALNKLRSTPGGGFAFPILDNPSKAFGLFFGKPVDLVTYDMPALDFSFTYMSPTIHIIGPLGAILSGRVGAKIDFAFGYDTTGLQAIKESHDPAHLLKGLYVSDTAKADGTGLGGPRRLSPDSASARPPRPRPASRGEEAHGRRWPVPPASIDDPPSRSGG